MALGLQGEGRETVICWLAVNHVDRDHCMWRREYRGFQRRSSFRQLADRFGQTVCSYSTLDVYRLSHSVWRLRKRKSHLGFWLRGFGLFGGGSCHRNGEWAECFFNH